MIEQTLYLECNSGISGDMTVAALLDLGADESVLRKALASLSVDGFTIEISRVSKSGLDACDFNVVLDGIHENHDHDMEYLHGHQHEHSHEHHHSHEEEHHHFHEDGHCHENAHHHEHATTVPHEHRGLPEIKAIIQNSELTTNAKHIALRIFQILASAEAKAHGVPEDQVHFHEVGAVDSIVDVAAVAICLDNLNIYKTIVTELCEGHGSIRCQHGVIPVPVPAVLNIVQQEGLTLHSVDVEGELVTPTGAAIVAAIRTEEKLPDKYKILNVGIGAGKRSYSRPSIVRAMLIQPDTKEKDVIYKLESNIDDSTGEMMGYVMDLLMKAGARDVHYIPVYMKKNRPAYQLNVICTKEEIPVLEDIIFRETTTIGIRKVEMERSVLSREILSFQSSLGEAKVKICVYDNIRKIYPEYNSITKLTQEHHLPFSDVYHRLVQEIDSKN